MIQKLKKLSVALPALSSFLAIMLEMAGVKVMLVHFMKCVQDMLY